MTRHRALLSHTACGLLAVLGALITGTLVPLLFGWSSAVVVSGSMRPLVARGDVVVTSPVPAGQIGAGPAGAGIGTVIRFDDPNRPGRSVLHRIARITPDGRLVTKGDANRRADATPVPAGAVTGRWRLAVPYIGLPYLWWRERDRPRLVAAGAVLVVLFFLVPQKGLGERLRSRRSGPPPSSRSGTGGTGRSRSPSGC